MKSNETAEVITGLAAAAWPGPARAQPPIRRVGVLFGVGKDPETERTFAASLARA
jgi:hypothetical protein